MSRIPPGIPLQRSTPEISEPLSILRPHMTTPATPGVMPDIVPGKVPNTFSIDVPFSAPAEPVKSKPKKRPNR